MRKMPRGAVALPRAEERIQRFVSQYGVLPFANLVES
jgi:hypothetical protein